MKNFIGEEVEVRFDQLPGLPTSFVWRGEEHKIDRVLSGWRKLDFKRRWWLRRHRDYLIVKTTTGQIFKLYFHRGPGRQYWVLSQEL